MKNFLGVIAGLLFGVAVSFAISGGPQYPVSGTDLNGSFAGVLLPKSSPSPTATASPTPTPTVSPNDSRNSLGVFAFAVSPTSGAAVGQFILFSHGRVFGPGNVRGEVDSTRATVRAILDTSNTFTPSPATPTPGSPTPTPTPVPTPITERVNGTMTAHATRTTDTKFTSTGIQLRGQATLNFNVGATDANNEPVIIRTESYKVRGFKQTVLAAATTATPTATATP